MATLGNTVDNRHLRPDGVETVPGGCCAGMCHWCPPHAASSLCRVPLPRGRTNTSAVPYTRRDVALPTTLNIHQDSSGGASSVLNMGSHSKLHTERSHVLAEGWCALKDVAGVIAFPRRIVFGFKNKVLCTLLPRMRNKDADSRIFPCGLGDILTASAHGSWFAFGC